jgi:predicted NUDIX family NTP pyrophosphohydrolase
MPKQSAGLLMYRQTAGQLEYLLVHPGGPLWKNKDHGAWTIPKGEPQPGEELLAAAQREVREEIGFLPTGEFLPLAAIKQKGGKIVRAWAVRADWNPAELKSNTFEIEWPPRSGKFQAFPEVDRAEFFGIEMARVKINTAQAPFLDQLALELKKRKH